MSTYQVTCTVSFNVSADIEAETPQAALDKAQNMAKFNPSLCHSCGRGKSDLESHDFIVCDEGGDVVLSEDDE